MSISEIAVAYLWFVLIASFALMVVRAAADDDLREDFRDIRKTWSERESLLRPVQRDFSRIEPTISQLLRSGFRSGQVTIRHEDSKHRLEFRKYIHDVGDYGIELVLPAYKWARKYLPSVQAYCDENGIPYRIRPKRKPRSREVLFVDCGRDSAAAYALAREVWLEIFGLPQNAFFDVDAYGISSYGELVDQPDQKPMSLGDIWRDTVGKSESPFARTPAGCAVKSLWLLSLPVVFLGLLISVIASHGEAAEWSIALADTKLSGSTAGLIFLCLYLANVALCTILGISGDQRLRPEHRILARTWRWTVRITLPIAVILVWTGT